MARAIAIWIFGLLASAIIGGFAGAHLSETYDAALFWGCPVEKFKVRHYPAWRERAANGFRERFRDSLRHSGTLVPFRSRFTQAAWGTRRARSHDFTWLFRR